MAHVVLTDEDREQVDRLVKEYDPEHHRLTAPYLAEIVDSQHREHVVTYLRNRVRGELIVPLLLTAAARAGVDEEVVEPIALHSWISRQWSERYSRFGQRIGRMFTYNLNHISEDALRAFGVFQHYLGQDRWRELENGMSAILDLVSNEMFNSFAIDAESIVLEAEAAIDEEDAP